MNLVNSRAYLGQADCEIDNVKNEAPNGMIQVQSLRDDISSLEQRVTILEEEMRK